MTETLRVEASGETVEEAKGNALRELELLAPSLDRTAVEYEVLSEGKRGLLGVGYEPARAAAVAPPEARLAAAPLSVRVGESDEAARLRRLLELAAAALGIHCRVELSEDEQAITGTFMGGEELGRLIGRHGQTLDALQLLAGAILQRGEEDRKEVVVDAAGYRERRRRRLEELALESAQETLSTGQRVELEPMSAAERKLVHCYLEHHPGVTTTSEGVEPHRYVVVEPA